MMSLASYYKDSDLPRALEIAQKALAMATANGDKLLVARAQNTYGNILKLKGEYKEAEVLYMAAAKTFEELHDTMRLALVYGNIGSYYSAVEQNQVAIMYHLRSLKLDQQRANSQNNVAATLNNIGNVYYSDRNYPKALEYYRQALSMNKVNGNRKNETINYLNLGNTFKDTRQIDSSLWYYTKAIELSVEQKIIWVAAAAHEGRGSCLLKQDKPAEAKQEFDVGLVAARQFGNKELVLYLQAGQAEAFSGLGQHDSALYTWQFCMDSAAKYDFAFLKSQLLLVGARIFEKTGDLAKANSLYKEYGELKDSMSYEQNAIMYRSFEERLRLEEEDHAEELIQKTQQEQTEAENRRNKIVLLFTAIVLLLAVGLGLFAFRSYRLKKKSHESISQQKDIIEEKNKEILSSIAYAQRLQQAILPSDKSWSSVFPSSYIFYQPKDIVAGDFYWLEKSGDTILFAAADCTGHGVPGALVSVVCSNALNRAVNEYNLTTPGSILDKVTELVVETFEKSGSTVYDGMDISLCAFDASTKMLKWSGANLPLWIISNSSEGREIKEIKPDKQPIGKFDLRKPFTTHSIQLNSGDTIFLFTDGYADQFGGPGGKKYKYKPMQELLRESSILTPVQQREKLVASFVNWKGKLEQVDDVCVIGIRF